MARTVDIITISPGIYGNIKKIKENIISIEKNTAKRFSVSHLISEFLAAKIFDFDLVRDEVNPGFDAYDIDDKKVQIKSRLYKGGDSAMIGTILNTKYEVGFDYALLFLLDNKYEIVDIYKASGVELQNYFNQENKKRKENGRTEVKVMNIFNFKKLAGKPLEFDISKSIL